MQENAHVLNTAYWLLTQTIYPNSVFPILADLIQEVGDYNKFIELWNMEEFITVEWYLALRKEQEIQQLKEFIFSQ